MENRLIIVIALMSLGLMSMAQKTGIIQMPASVEIQKATFIVSRLTTILPDKNSSLHNYLQSQVKTLTGLELKITQNAHRQAN